MACHYISGAGTFELQVVATDLDAFSRWAMDTLFKLPNVKDLHTSFSLGEVKAGAALPLGHLRCRCWPGACRTSGSVLACKGPSWRRPCRACVNTPRATSSPAW
jgi:hypothetical protein